jgi:cytochrome P450
MQTTRNIISSSPVELTSKGAAPTLVHSILQSNLPSSEKSFDSINDEVSTVLGAALETTAQTLRVVFYHVYSNPSVLHRLRGEVATAAKTSGGQQQITLKVLEQLPYLTSVIMEGLRLSPGLATRMARIAPDRPLVYDSWTVPAGTPIGMTTLLMHTDERI